MPTQCSIDIHHTVIQANTTTQAESAQANTITKTYTTTQTNTKNTSDRELFGDKRAGEVGHGAGAGARGMGPESSISNPKSVFQNGKSKPFILLVANLI